MSLTTIVFDFDGTLIDSNRIKHDAYFDLFPKDKHHEQTIKTVLETMFEASRFDILREIVLRLENNESDSVIDSIVERLATQYGDLTLERTQKCMETPGAEVVLRELSTKYGLYLSSTTPEDTLVKLVESRNWTDYFKGIYGYPKKKTETLLHIMALRGVTPDKVLVVGDGESDSRSALETGCHFFHIHCNAALSDTLTIVDYI